MIYLYAIAEGLTTLPNVAGIDGAPVSRRTHERLDLVVSEHDHGSVEPTDERILVHGAVVEELLGCTDALLPARFGRAFRDDEALTSAVDGRATEIREALARVRGCVEVGVRVIRPPDPPPIADSGRGYMEERRARIAAAERLAEEIHEPLAGLARSSAHAAASTPRLLLSGAYLVDPADVARFRERVGSLETEHTELSFACTGPWPPYSFASLGDT
jgi:hypothetical protein